MSPALSVKAALFALIDYTLATEKSCAIEEMLRFSSFDDWAAYILSDTIYGCALIVLLADFSDAELHRELRELWDTHNPA